MPKYNINDIRSCVSHELVYTTVWTLKATKILQNVSQEVVTVNFDRPA